MASGAQLHPVHCVCGACAGSEPYVVSANVDGQGGFIDDKPVWSIAEITAHLNRSAFPWTDIPGAGWSSEGFDARPASGDLLQLTFGFHTVETIAAAPYHFEIDGQVYDLGSAVGFQAFSVGQQEAARKTITLWNELVALDIVETTADQADLTYSNYTKLPGTQAFAFLPYSYSEPYAKLAGDIWVNGLASSNLELDNGGYGLLTLMHETGHALGLMHPGDYDASSDEAFTYASHAEYFQDSRQYSVMSYFNAEFTDAAHVDWSRLERVYGQTPLLHDIAAIQAIYGADPTTRADGTIYGFNSTANLNVFDFGLNTMPVISIYDAGGIDTLDFSGWNTASTIDLNPGAFSSGGGSGIVPLEDLKAAGLVPSDFTQAEYDALRTAYNSPDGLLHDNISIAYGTIIENAIGGGGNDTIIGNSVANHLVGGAGDDLLAGDGGSDLLEGGDGVDTVSYAASDSSVNLDLGRSDGQTGGHAEGDVLTGIENVTGSRFDDILAGSSSANVIDGGGGADVMRGSAGDDTYVVDDVGDDVTEMSAEGTDTVMSSVTYTLPEDVENLVLLGAAAADAVGNAQSNTIVGNSAANILDGAGGADLMQGGAGDDVYIVDQPTDEIVERAGEGWDQVSSSTSYVLPKHVEKLVLTGTSSTGGSGNSSDNIIIGNFAGNVLSGGAGKDVLDGAGGADDLRGGRGHDTYIVDNAGDTVIEAAGEGTDTIRTYVSYSLPDHVEALALGGAGVTDATGNALDNRLYGNAKANV
ncbi:M10 family metallopeptidase, partial [Sphingosinicella terrae]|uniref:M10 family metallopeptidase n=1 Tax=Sphingosinicella terrae TaxID=2172047 RepID=UPI0025490F76